MGAAAAGKMGNQSLLCAQNPPQGGRNHANRGAGVQGIKATE